MIKKILFTAVLLITSAFASEIEWAKDYESAIEEATSKNKPVLFVYSRHSCKYCVLLEETAFKDERVIKALGRDFVSVTSYTDEDDYTPIDLMTPGTPAIWFLKPDGEPMFAPIMGAVDAENFLKALGIVKNEFDKGLGR